MENKLLNQIKYFPFFEKFHEKPEEKQVQTTLVHAQGNRLNLSPVNSEIKSSFKFDYPKLS